MSRVKAKEFSQQIKAYKADSRVARAKAAEILDQETVLVRWLGKTERWPRSKCQASRHYYTNNEELKEDCATCKSAICWSCRGMQKRACKCDQ